jgi:hypothetical protein
VDYRHWPTSRYLSRVFLWSDAERSTTKAY